MIHDLHALDRRGQVVPGQIEIVDCHAPCGHVFRVQFLERAGVVIREAVNPLHVMAQLGQTLGQMRPDKTRGTGHKYSHVCILPQRRKGRKERRNRRSGETERRQTADGAKRARLNPRLCIASWYLAVDTWQLSKAPASPAIAGPAGAWLVFRTNSGLLQSPFDYSGGSYGIACGVEWCRSIPLCMSNLFHSTMLPR